MRKPISPEKRREYLKRYYEKHRDQVNAYHREYEKNNPDKVALWRLHYAQNLINNSTQEEMKNGD